MKSFLVSCVLSMAVIFAATGCAEPEVPELGLEDSSGPVVTANPYSCRLDHPFPYPSGVSYVGVHANPENNDYVDCLTAPAYEFAWHALKGHGVGQPNTFSPDGTVTYVTSTHPAPDGCTVHAINTLDGSTLWCRSYLDAVWSTMEVDEDGNLYFTAIAKMISLNAQGEKRWEVSGLANSEGKETQGLFGVHFHPDGHVVTVTNDGEVLLVRRSDGVILSSLSIPDAYGFVPPEALNLNIDILTVLPQYISEDLASFAYQNGSDEIFASFLGAGGNFSDNTVGIASNGDIYVIGGGQDPDHGALVQIRVDGTPDQPTLAAGWYMNTVGGSAATPSISPDGKFVHINDGASAKTLLDPLSIEAHVRVADIEACNANTDEDPDPAVCAQVYSVPLKTGSAGGSTPLLDDAVHYIFETTITAFEDKGTVDVHAYQGETLLWETVLPDKMNWTSAMTVSKNHLLGTATRFTISDVEVLNVKLPQTSQSELILLDRHTGEVAFRAPVSDDASSTVTIGPDGALYVNMLGIFHVAAKDTRPVVGVMKFNPVLP
jgi:hypothetical protein